MNRLAYVLSVGRWRLNSTGADAGSDAADAEVDGILGQRRLRARRRFFQAVLEDDDRGVLEGIEADDFDLDRAQGSCYFVARAIARDTRYTP